MHVAGYSQGNIRELLGLPDARRADGSPSLPDEPRTRARAGGTRERLEVVCGCHDKAREWELAMAPLVAAAEEEGWVEVGEEEEEEDVEALGLLRRGVALLRGGEAGEELCQALAAVAHGPVTPRGVPRAAFTF